MRRGTADRGWLAIWISPQIVSLVSIWGNLVQGPEQHNGRVSIGPESTDRVRVRSFAVPCFVRRLCLDRRMDRLMARSSLCSRVDKRAQKRKTGFWEA